MPSTNSQIRFLHGTAAGYAAIQSKDPNALYFCTDTKQLFLGTEEYTKGAAKLSAQPTESTVGEHGKLYAYNGSLYLCEVASGTYVWTRVANINDKQGTVTSVGAGEGLGIASGSENPITGSGTLVHAVPEGAAVHADAGTDQTAEFGEAVEVEFVETDKFGHVIGIHKHTITLPEETEVSVSNETAEAETLEAGATFQAVVEVVKGDGSHEVKRTVKTFTLPGDKDTTYTFDSTEEGTLVVTPSGQTAQKIVIKGWEDLAKKSDLTKLFRYKGTVASTEELPADAVEGDVYHVTADSAEYVYASVDGQLKWESLGGILDLSEYAKSNEVIQRVTGAEGEVAQFNADGTLSSTGHKLEADVPADAKFTDTVYEHPEHAAKENGLYKVTVDGQGHVSEATPVTAEDINKLGVTADEAKHAESADEATKATQDAEGNVITETYATKEEAKLVWEEF